MQRWWDGARWTEQTRQKPAPTAPPPPAATQFAGLEPPASSAGAAPLAAQPLLQAQPSLMEANTRSVTAIVVTVLYVLLDAATGIAPLGVVPVLFAIRALSRGEKLAPLALVAAAVAVVVGLTSVAHH
jgi:hypothetical protein